MGWARAAAYALASLTHLVTAGLFTSGLLLVVLGLETVVQPLIGLMLLGFVTLVRPRPSRLDPELPTLRRADAPALYALLDEITEAVGVRRLDVVQFSPDFVIRAAAYGIRRRRRLEIGLPLWLALAPQQRVAVVAHEVGHFASGDARHGVLVGSALSSLSVGDGLMARSPDGEDTLQSVSLPVSRHADEMAEAARGFSMRNRAADATLWLPGLVMRGTARRLMRLTRPGARRTEFLADAVAARVASTRAAVSALHDRELADAVNAEVHRLAVARRTFRGPGAVRRTDEAFWAGIAAHAAALRERGEGGAAAELHDVRRCDTAVTTGSGSGLPSHAERIERLARGAARPAAVTFDEAKAEAVEGELHEPKLLLARKVVQDCVHA